MTNRKRTSRLAGALMAAALLAMSAGEALADNVLHIAREQDSTTFDPIFTILAPDVWVPNQFYSTLVRANADATDIVPDRSEEHTSELQSLMRISYAVFCLKKKKPHTYTSSS